MENNKKTELDKDKKEELNDTELEKVAGGMNKTDLVKAIAGKAKLKL